MNKIKLLREEKNILQEDLAKILGVTQKTISNYENETRDIPTESLKILSEYFNVSIDYLLGKSDKSNSKSEDFDADKIRIGLSTNDYENITDNQRKQIEEFAKLVLKDNLKNKDNK